MDALKKEETYTINDIYALPDGNSFVPINHCLLSAADDQNLLCGAKA